ncbi:MAG: PEP-CTERM sorting domain-containing protein [Sedimentisphaerales bacterium]|nr:PEP-CTERM sorting domain-containing protein [Sedimentisphaerales bacterium]
MKNDFSRQNFCVITVLPLLLSSLALAASDPVVIEEFEDIGFSHYTVVNPADSSVGDIVGFIVEVDYQYGLLAYTNNGWLAQGMTDFMEEPLNPTTWDLKMKVNYSSVTYDLTWRQFFGGIDYPFGDVKAIGYYVSYSEISPDTYKFDWSYSESPYHLPILPGEILGDFSANVDGPCSEYLLAYIDDAQNDTFSNNGLASFRGEAIPEPTSLVLFCLGGLVFFRKRKV